MLKKILIPITGIVLVWAIALVITTCKDPDTGGSDPITSTAALETAIADANTAKAGVEINTDAANVDVGTKWVTQEEMDALLDAIEAAEAALANSTTQTQITNAAAALNAAIGVFNQAKKDGEKPVTTPCECTGEDDCTCDEDCDCAECETPPACECTGKDDCNCGTDCDCAACETPPACDCDDDCEDPDCECGCDQTPALIDLTWNNGTVTSREYNGTTTASVAAQPTLSGVSAGDNVTVKIGIVAFTSVNAGTNTFSVSGYGIEGANAGKYKITGQPSFTGAITKKQITITPTTGQSKVYGAADPDVFSFTPNPSLIGSDSFEGKLGYGESGSNTNAGTYLFTLGTLSAGNNYQLALGGSVTFEITKANQATLTIIGGNIDKTTADSNFTLSTTGGSGTGAVSYQVTTGNDVVSISGNTVTILKAGTATVTATKAADTNYNVVTSAPITITVTQPGKLPGAAVDAPTLDTRGETSITVIAVTPPGNGQTVEYGISPIDPNGETWNTPSSWQDGEAFSGLTAYNAYYVFARAKENNTHNAGEPSKLMVVTGAFDHEINLTTETGTLVTINASNEDTILISGDGTNNGDGRSVTIDCGSGNTVSIYIAPGTVIQGWTEASNGIETRSIAVTGGAVITGLGSCITITVGTTSAAQPSNTGINASGGDLELAGTFGDINGGFAAINASGNIIISGTTGNISGGNHTSGYTGGRGISTTNGNITISGITGNISGGNHTDNTDGGHGIYGGVGYNTVTISGTTGNISGGNSVSGNGGSGIIVGSSSGNGQVTISGTTGIISGGSGNKINDTYCSGIFTMSGSGGHSVTITDSASIVGIQGGETEGNGILTDLLSIAKPYTRIGFVNGGTNGYAFAELNLMYFYETYQEWIDAQQP